MLDMRLIAINLLIVALSPYLLYQKFSRWFRRRNNHEFKPQRWTAEPPTGPPPLTDHTPHVVFVGATYGEMLIMERLNADLTQSRPDIRTTWVLRDGRTIAEIMSKRPNQALGIWPFEFFIPVLNWLRQHRPDVVVVTEKIWYPNLVIASANHGAKVVLVNGRTNTRTSWLRRLGSWFFRWILDSFRVLCFQDEVHVERVKHLLPKRCDVRVTGNLKYDFKRPLLDPKQEESLAAWLTDPSGTPLLAAGSTTSPEEEEYVLDAFERVREKGPCRLLIAPRRLDRVPDLAQAIARRGLRVSRRSEGPATADVYVLDTLGELAFAYSFALAAYVGGTLKGVGHNVIEPLEWGIPVSYGPREGHFREMQRASEMAGVGFKTHTPPELAEHWTRVVSDAEFRAEVHREAEKMLTNQRGAVGRTVEALVEVVDEVLAERRVTASADRVVSSA